MAIYELLGVNVLDKSKFSLFANTFHTLQDTVTKGGEGALDPAKRDLLEHAHTEGGRLFVRDHTRQALALLEHCAADRRLLVRDFAGNLALDDFLDDKNLPYVKGLRIATMVLSDAGCAALPRPSGRGINGACPLETHKLYMFAAAEQGGETLRHVAPATKTQLYRAFSRSHPPIR